jgi:3-hydroxyacyl-CoA dehydrogenase/enoyl-CoA hydratase/3-hydroxybutyryl-CoA epimerase
VIEAVVENLEVKKKVLAEVEEHVRPDTLIASNTSSLSITEMAASLRRPERFVGMHFFNPPNRMPLVEVVPGARSGSQAVSDAVRAVLALGKTPIVVRDCPGFLVNRLLMPYLNECVRLIEEGGDFVAVDKIFQDFGMPMGPFTLLDEIGIDVARDVGRVLSRAYGHRMEASAVIESLAGRADLLGKKTGRGFYLHAGRKRIPNPEMRRLIAEPHGTADRQGSAERRGSGKGVPGRDETRDRPLLAMVNEAARALQEGIVASAQEADLALILGTGFPPFRGGLLSWADSRGIRVIHDMLAEFARRHGERFTPAPLIITLASEGKGFLSQ